MLLSWNVFPNVEVSFLPVWHSHKAIDQAFSRTLRRLQIMDAITLSDFCKELTKTYNGRASFVHMQAIASWSDIYEKKSIETSALFLALPSFSFSLVGEQQN